MPWSEFRFVDWMKYWKSSKFFGKVYMFKWKREIYFLSLQVFQDCSLDKTLNYQIHWKTMTNFFLGGEGLKQENFHQSQFYSILGHWID